MRPGLICNRKVRVLRELETESGRLKGMYVYLVLENTLRASPLDAKEQFERQIKDFQVVYGKAMLESRARKKLQSLLGEHEK